MDYQTLIDAPTWAFIDKTNACYPEDTATRPIVEQRQIYDAMCGVFARGYPAGVTSQDHAIGAVPCRRYPGAAPTVVYLHGGGFVVGGLESHDDICAEIRARTGLGVVSVDYRLSPDHRHPAAFDDAVTVAQTLISQGDTIILVGDSAGGNLAAAVSHRLRASPALLGQVLIYPGLGGDQDRGSYLAHANAPLQTRDDVLFYAAIRFEGPIPVGDATAAPLQDTDFTGLPPTLAISAECDPIADDAHEYAAKINAAGGRAVWVQEPGLPHAYLRARSSVPRAAQSFDRIIAAISAMAKREWKPK